MNELTLPYPVSCNVYYRNFRGMTVKSAAAREYQAAIRAIAYREGIRTPLSGAIHVEFTYHPKRPKKWKGGPVRSQDISNVVKVAEDALNGVGWDDDSSITHLSITKAEPVDGGALVVRWGLVSTTMR